MKTLEFNCLTYDLNTLSKGIASLCCDFSLGMDVLVACGFFQYAFHGPGFYNFLWSPLYSQLYAQLDTLHSQGHTAWTNPSEIWAEVSLIATLAYCVPVKPALCE